MGLARVGDKLCWPGLGLPICSGAAPGQGVALDLDDAHVRLSAISPGDPGRIDPSALVEDWRSGIPDGFVKSVREILDGPQGSLFEDREKQLGGLEPSAAGYPLAELLLENAASAVSNTQGGSMGQAASNTLREWANRHSRQIEEHHRREGGQMSATDIRSRLSESIRRADFDSLAKRLTGARESVTLAPEKKTGIDQGVRLP